MKTSVAFFLSVVVLALAVPVAKFDDGLSASPSLEERVAFDGIIAYDAPTDPKRVKTQVGKRSPEIEGVDLVYNTPTAPERVGTQAEKRSPAGAGAPNNKGGNNHNEVDPNEPDDNNDTEDHNTDTNEAAKE